MYEPGSQPPTAGLQAKVTWADGAARDWVVCDLCRGGETRRGCEAKTGRKEAGGRRREQKDPKEDERSHRGPPVQGGTCGASSTPVCLRQSWHGRPGTVCRDQILQLFGVRLCSWTFHDGTQVPPQVSSKEETGPYGDLRRLPGGWAGWPGRVTERMETVL